jgi:hypothetical protein
MLVLILMLPIRREAQEMELPIARDRGAHVLGGVGLVS